MSDITAEFAIEYIQETCEDCPEYKDGQCISNSHCFEVKKMAIDSIKAVEKYKDAYNKGYKDGAEAVAVHEKLSNDESGLVRKEDVLTILFKNWHDHSGDDAMQMSIDDVRLL